MTAERALLNRAARILDARIGLKPDISFRPRLARALNDVAEEMKLDGETLVDSISNDPAVFDALLNRITVQESGFFRHSEQFDLSSGRCFQTFEPRCRPGARRVPTGKRRTAWR